MRLCLTALLISGLLLSCSGERKPPRLLNRRALAYIHSGQLDSAEIFLRRAVAESTTYIGAYNNLGALLNDMGRAEAGESVLTIALSMDSTDTRLMLNMGRSLFGQRRYADALEYLSRALSPDTKDAMGLTLLGKTLDRLHRFDDAEEASALPLLVLLRGEELAVR